MPTSLFYPTFYNTSQVKLGLALGTHLCWLLFLSEMYKLSKDWTQQIYELIVLKKYLLIQVPSREEIGARIKRAEPKLKRKKSLLCTAVGSVERKNDAPSQDEFFGTKYIHHKCYRLDLTWYTFRKIWLGHLFCFWCKLKSGEMFNVKGIEWGQST